MTDYELRRNITDVRDRIVRACQKAGRDETDVTLVAVSKKVSESRIAAAIDEGIQHFGESYVQEASEKIACPALQNRGVEWHFIGHLQRNKVREITGKFELIHSVDSIALAEEISRRSTLNGMVTPILLEIRLDMTAPKYGFLLEDLDSALAIVQAYPGVLVRGLMGIPPYSDIAEDSRPPFQKLKSLFDKLPAINRTVLSMGMSGDFEIAIEEGATHVRVGTAIFGQR